MTTEKTLDQSEQKDELTANMVYTTLEDNTPSFRETYTIFSKRVHDDGPPKLDADEQSLYRQKVKDLNMGIDEIAPWVMEGMKLKDSGRKILFLTDRLSLNTYKRANFIDHPGLWDMVMAEHDMRHNLTNDVHADYGEGKSHDGSLDLFLRNRVHKSQMRMFIKVAHASPELWERLQSLDGQEIVIEYEGDTLSIYLDLNNITQPSYQIAVGRIQLIKEANNQN